jgi:hypothetical protein
MINRFKGRHYFYERWVTTICGATIMVPGTLFNGGEVVFFRISFHGIWVKKVYQLSG